MKKYTLKTERVIIPKISTYPDSIVEITMECYDKRVLDWFDEHLEEFIHNAQDDLKQR